MLLGIWGPFAIGKTTHLRHYMETRNSGSPVYDLIPLQRVIFVHADLSTEYHMVRGDFVAKKLTGHDNHWMGKQEYKIQHINDMIADDRRYWVVESARYFSGMYEHLVKAHDDSGGGLRFILPITDGPTMIKFLKARCESKDKAFRADCWVDGGKAEYECDARYTNAAKKWFGPNGIPYMTVPIDETRNEFYRVSACLDAWLKVKPDRWYGDVQLYKNMAPKLSQDDFVKLHTNQYPLAEPEQPQRKGRY